MEYCRILLSRWIFVDSRPFYILENKYFLDFVFALNPRFEVPSRRTVSSKWLQLEYEHVKDSVTNVCTNSL